LFVHSFSTQEETMKWYRLAVLPEQVEADPHLQKNLAVAGVMRSLGDGREHTRGEIMHDFGFDTFCYDHGLRALDRMVKLRFVDVRVGDYEPDREIEAQRLERIESIHCFPRVPGGFAEVLRMVDMGLLDRFLRNGKAIEAMRILPLATGEVLQMTNSAGEYMETFVYRPGFKITFDRAQAEPESETPITEKTPAEEPAALRPLQLQAAGGR
jgi:hypothetical protein